MGKCRQACPLALAFALWLCPLAASAQSLTLTLTVMPGAAAFGLTAGSAVNAGAPTLTVKTSWVGLPGEDLTLYGYFSSASSALVHTNASNPFDIPSSRVEAGLNGGALGAFNQTGPFGAAGAGRALFVQTLTVGTIISNRTDTVALNINLAGFPIPADTYTGTLRVRARIAP